jgi:hypothetical protein
MKTILLIAALCGASAFANAQTFGSQPSNNFGSSMYVPPGGDQQVNGFTRSNGTYVEPYHRSQADGNPYNNYSTQGNVNPYTGQEGHRKPGY